MKRTVILSTTADEYYLFCIPIVARAWELQGFDSHLVVCADGGVFSPVLIKILNYLPLGCSIDQIKQKVFTENNPALLSQCARLYSASLRPEGYVVIGAADRFIASDFVCKNYDKINVFGHPLSIPVCYTGMMAEKWKEVMKSGNLRKDLKRFCNLSTIEQARVADQDILRAKLLGYEINFVTNYNNIFNQGADVRLPKDPLKEENFNEIEAMCKKTYPDVDWEWLDDYRNYFLHQKEYDHAT